MPPVILIKSSSKHPVLPSHNKTALKKDFITIDRVWRNMIYLIEEIHLNLFMRINMRILSIVVGHYVPFCIGRGTQATGRYQTGH